MDVFSADDVGADNVRGHVWGATVYAGFRSLLCELKASEKAQSDVAESVLGAWSTAHVRARAGSMDMAMAVVSWSCCGQAILDTPQMLDAVAESRIRASDHEQASAELVLCHGSGSSSGQ